MSKDTTAIKWINRVIKRQRLKMALLIFINALLSLSLVAFAFAVKGIIDGAVGTDNAPPNQHSLIVWSIVIGAIVIFQFVFRYLSNSLSEIIKARAEMDIKSHVFSSILKKDYKTITEYHSGELINRLTSDVGIVADGYSKVLPVAIASIIRLLSAVVALIIIDVIFAGVFVGAGLLVFLVITLMKKKLKTLHKDVQQTDGKVRSFMQESMENILALKTFGVEDKVGEKNDALQKDNFKVKMKRKTYSVLGYATYNMIFSAGYIFALIYGAFMIFNGSGMTYGALSAILQLVNNVQVPFASLSNVVPSYFAMIASADRLIEIENLKEEEGLPRVDKAETYNELNKIVFENVYFSYGRDTVLKAISLEIKKGDFMVISGTSGVGKSTLLKVLLGVYEVDNGKVYLDCNGKEISVGQSVRPLFSYVPQGNLLFSGTIRENLLFANADANDEQIKKALNISCLTEFVETLPQGLDTVVGEKGLGLSEGQVQRIAIARAILCNSPILLLDEATSALDEQTEEELLKNLKGLEDITLIIISHKHASEKICNRHIEIKDGAIVES